MHPNGVEPKRPADQSGLHTLGKSQISQKKHNIGGSEKTYYATIVYALTAFLGPPLAPHGLQGLVPIRHKRFLASLKDPFRHPKFGLRGFVQEQDFG